MDGMVRMHLMRQQLQCGLLLLWHVPILSLLLRLDDCTWSMHQARQELLLLLLWMLLLILQLLCIHSSRLHVSAVLS